MSYNLLKGKNGIIFGALNDQSLAWKTALRCHEEGAKIVLTNAPIALRMGEINKLAEQCGGAPVIAADVTSNDDIQKLFEKSMEHFGGKIDFIFGRKIEHHASLLDQALQGCLRAILALFGDPFDGVSDVIALWLNAHSLLLSIEIAIDSD